MLDDLIKTIQAKMRNVITAVENQTKKSLEILKAKRSAIQQQINATESSLEEADKLLKRSTNAEVVELKKSLQTIFQGLNQTEPIVHDSSSLKTFVFVENQKVLDIVNEEEIGFWKEPYRTKTSESLAEGEGLKEGIVARKAQINLTTKNAEKKQAPMLRRQERHNEGTLTALMSTESLVQQGGCDNHTHEENGGVHII